MEWWRKWREEGEGREEWSKGGNEGGQEHPDGKPTSGSSSQRKQGMKRGQKRVQGKTGGAFVLNRWRDRVTKRLMWGGCMFPPPYWDGDCGDTGRKARVTKGEAGVGGEFGGCGWKSVLQLWLCCGASCGYRVWRKISASTSLPGFKDRNLGPFVQAVFLRNITYAPQVVVRGSCCHSFAPWSQSNRKQNHRRPNSGILLEVKGLPTESFCRRSVSSMCALLHLILTGAVL